MAVMFIDVDFSKKVNDALVHAAGDAVLKEFARRVSHAVRSTDTTARLPADEFVVLLEGAGSVEEVERIAEKVFSALARPMVVKDRHGELTVTASVGLVFNDSHSGARAPAFLAAADDALDQAKDAGRNTHRVFELA